jgi:PRTRC genetic system protein A
MVPIHAVPKPQPEEPAQFPPDALCYLLGSNGVFKQIKNPFYTARVKVNGAGHLAEIKEDAAVHVPKLPLDLLRRVEGFFATVYQARKSEAVVLLHFDAIKRQWLVEAPPQTVRGLHVSYDLSTLPTPAEGCQRFGSIHSHADASAFHSATDDKDEAAFDGLHITISNLDQPVHSYSARWMLAGAEFKVELADVVEQTALPACDPEWLAKVKEETFEPQSFGCSELLPASVDPRMDMEEYYGYLESMREEIDGEMHALNLSR